MPVNTGLLRACDAPDNPRYAVLKPLAAGQPTELPSCIKFYYAIQKYRRWTWQRKLHPRVRAEQALT